MTRRGALIALEGIDGSGKTTQAALLGERLRREGLSVVLSKEPTQGPWGRKIRESKTTRRMEPELELHAFINDRKEHVADLIDPSLVRGQVVVIDRYYFSTVAYQGARGLDPKKLLEQNEAFAPRPDLLVILEVKPALGLERIAGRGDKADLFEKADNLQRAAAIFASLEGAHVLRIDGTKPIAEIHEEIWRALRAGPLLHAFGSRPGGKYSYIGEQDAVADDPSLLNGPAVRG